MQSAKVNKGDKRRQRNQGLIENKNANFEKRERK